MVKKAFFVRIVAFLMVFIIFGGCLGIAPSSAYTLPAGYTLSNSYKSGVYYERLCQVQLTGDQRADIAAIALSQVGYHEGPKGVFSGYGTGSANYAEYNRYAYHLDNAAWCGSFVAWCAAMAGIPTTILPKTAAAKPDYWKMVGKTKLEGAAAKTPEDLVINGGSYIPRVGDLAFFGSKSTGNAEKNYCSHIGLIVDVQVTYTASTVTRIVVQTAEGNYSDKVTLKTYTFDANNRNGHAYNAVYLNTFGIPNYNAKNYGDVNNSYAALDIGAYGGSYLRKGGAISNAVRKLQMGLNMVSLLDKGSEISLVTVDGDFGDATLTAVKKFQYENDLDVDGIVGRDTWVALRAAVTALTSKVESDFIIKNGKLYAYKGYDTKVILPAYLQTVGGYAFGLAGHVIEVTLPGSVGTLESHAFSACSQLKTVYYEGNATAFASIRVANGNERLTAAELVCLRCEVIFRVEGQSDKKVIVNVGEVPALPSTVVTEKSENAYYTYEFAGWMLNGKLYTSMPKVEGNCTLVASFTQVARKVNTATLYELMAAVRSGNSSDIAKYDFCIDGKLDNWDIQALLAYLATK